MLKYVIKRNQDIVMFDQLKISNAILKAFMSIYTDRTTEDLARFSDVVADKVVYILNKKYENSALDEYPNIEEIQDLVEDTLMQMGEKQVAKEYIVYRAKHQELRENRSLVMDIDKIFVEYTDQSDWKVKENANMGYSLQGLNNHISQEVIKNIWLNKVYPSAIKEAYITGDFHIHDLGCFATYCCGWSLEDLLLKGFTGVTGKIESKPAKHLRAALGQLVNFYYTLQGESAGAQAISSFDTYLAPFIRYDNLEYRQVKQAMQEFVFNMNVPTRVGFQTPFTNLTLDLLCPSTLKNVPAIIGGKSYENYTYSDFQEEMDMFNQAFCEVMMEGDAKGRIFTFPIPTYNISKNFDWDRPVVNKVMEMSAKYGLPYFANFVNSDMSPDDARSMCCRLRLDNRELRKRGGGLFGANPLTGSIGVVTINMPRLGYISKTEYEFTIKLRRLMDLAKASLEIKRKILEKNMKNGLYPYSRFYLDIVNERFGEYFKNHFSTIGLNGMNEAIKNLLGENESIATETGKAFAERILEYMRTVIIEYQEETGNLYNLEATPAEGVTYRLAKLDKKLYPNIITAGNDIPYYTNSTQLPVGYTTDIFEAIELQETLQTMYTGGTVIHGFLGERIEDPEACKALVRKIMNNFTIPYFTVSPTFSICPDHGYITGEKHQCPTCSTKTEVWTRIVGYHRPVQNWNEAKQEEFKDRLEFEVCGCCLEEDDC
ncbi:MAG: ribonucleoside triphosphate reductase [Clostridiales bacterium GWE2_32_10]|nr:MAG: ribonucleoside triphosphate reductase [Clostridiales bacterium GWE2_32_10]HBY21222.1 ribonucleoside triphosphate reductase [Clostridiales bacterium]